MRFHIGFSFRLKTLKKFLFPILIGLLSYFGFSFLNLGIVYAAANVNLDTYYIFDVPEMDYENFTTHGYKIVDLVDEFKSYNEYYNIVANISVNKNTLNPILNISIIPKNITYGDYRIYIQNGTSYGDIYFSFSISENFHYYTLSATGTDSTFNTNYNYIKSCLQNNSCTGSTYSSYFTSAAGRPKADNNNDYDLTTNSNVFQFVYYSDIEIKYSLPTSTSSSLYYKALNYFGDNKQPGDNILPYYDILHPSENDSFSSFLEKQPYIYANIDIVDLSSFNIKYEYYVNSIDVNDYLDNLVQNKFYYGRINHNNNYYSYEQLNCSSSSTGTTSNNKISTTINNFSCTNDLTVYDKFFISVYPRYDDDALNYSIYDFSLSSSGFSTFSVKSYNYFVDNFENLSSGFKLLVSSKDTLNNDDIYIWSNNLYVAVDYLPNIDTSIDTLTNGSWLQSVLYPIRFNFGHTTNNMLLVYDDISYSQVQSSDLLFYLKTSMIISFESSNTFYYYDNNNDIVSNSITLTYDAIIDENNYSSIEQYFMQVDNFINSINNDLYSYHTLMDNIYNTIPSFLQLVLQVLYILLLSFLLFKVLRK